MYSPGSTIKFREALTALGAPARLCHGNSRSRTAVAKRISDGGEPNPARADQGSAAAFGKARKRHWPRSLTAWHDCRCCQTACSRFSGELVFVGGCTTALLITDKAAA